MCKAPRCRRPSIVSNTVHAENGERIVGYDNERGKGDHKHLREQELPYTFIDIDTLMADFWRDVEEQKK